MVDVPAALLKLRLEECFGSGEGGCVDGVLAFANAWEIYGEIPVSEVVFIVGHR